MIITRTTNVKKHVSRKALTTLSVTIAIATVVMAATAWQTPQVTATSLEEIKVSREISAPVDKVWNIVSNVDNETKYWSTFKAIKNINKTDNVTEREVTHPSPQGDTKTRQFVTVNPEQFVVETNITEGPVTGTRLLTLSPSSDNNITRTDVVWEVDLSSIPAIGQGFAKDGIKTTTEEALGNIAAEVEVK
jgi:uncharacterized protein YndB with AHSA1/START domain